MAWIASIERKEGRGKLQPTQVTAYVKVFQTDDRNSIIQIDTYGSSDREMPNKQSQTLQLGREAAKQLYDLLSETYNFQS